MSAFVFIRGNRKALERIELISTMRLAMQGSSKDVERHMARLAREAEIPLRFD
jgi:hypothetical protein